MEKRREHLNAPYKFLPEVPDPLLFRLNSIQGDIDCPLRLFTNLLSTQRSDLNLIMNEPYFDASPCEKIVFHDEYECSNYIPLPVSVNIDPANKLKTQLSGYSIKNMPMEDSESEM